MAHNTPLEIAFRSGIPSGILFVIFETLGVLYVLVRIFWKRKNLRISDVFSSCAIMAFTVMSSVETMVCSINDVFSIDMALLFYLAFGSVFFFGVADKGQAIP